MDGTNNIGKKSLVFKRSNLKIEKCCLIVGELISYFIWLDMILVGLIMYMNGIQYNLLKI